MNTDQVVACVDLVARCGGRDFEIGYLHEGVPLEDAGWWASVSFKGARIMEQDHRSPSGAALALAERLLNDAACRCGKPVALSDDRPGCRWRLMGQRWEPGCDVAPIRVAGERGDVAAMARAWQERHPGDNRAARRKAKRRR